MMQSFCDEACGLLHTIQALIQSINTLTEKHPAILENKRYWQKGKINIPIKVYCDSKSNLKRLQNWISYKQVCFVSYYNKYKERPRTASTEHDLILTKQRLILFH